MNSKNHCDDFGKKSRFCYLDMTKMTFLGRFSSDLEKVRVSRKRDYQKKCQHFR
jgi:hypothetical protein